MDIKTSLFEGEWVHLTPIDPEQDAQVESKWTHNPRYLRMLYSEPARPLSPAQVKKKYEAIEKEAEEGKNLFHFAIRTRTEQNQERLIGFAQLFWIDWTNSSGVVRLGIGNPDDWGRGYGSDSLRLLLRYAFAELNLFGLMAFIPEYNQVALRLFQRAGFIEEVRRREALNRDGRYWDMIHVGILRDQWIAHAQT